VKQTNQRIRREHFKRNIWEKFKNNEEACWIRTLCQNSPGTEWSPMPEKEVTTALKQC